MKSFKDYRPTTETVQVGDKELEVREFSIAKRDALLRVLFKDLDIGKIMAPFQKVDEKKKALIAKLYQEKRDAPTIEETQGLTYKEAALENAEELKNVLFKLLSNDASLVDCIALDTAANRKVLEFNGEMSEDSEHGYEYNSKMVAWVRENMGWSQEPEILKAIFKVNDFGGLLKNYMSLVASATGADQTTETEVEKEKAND